MSRPCILDEVGVIKKQLEENSPTVSDVFISFAINYLAISIIACCK